MSFTYNRDIPAANNNPSSDQPLMQTNTNSIYDIINQDHVTFGNGTESGYHKVLHFKNFSNGITPPVNPPSDSSHGQLYTRTRDGYNQLFYEDTGGTVYQVTSFPQASNNGYTYVPGGILFQWGQIASAGTSGTVTFPTPFPSGNPPFTIQVSLERTSANQTVTVDSATIPTATTFHYLISSGTNKLYWLAIGN